ncbi:MAG: hypothetical protein ACKVTZ_16880 [Bacteroidia bacterium]
MTKKIDLSPAFSTLISSLYPTIDWKKVTLYEGLPWFMPEGSAIAVVLPSAYSLSHTHIYFKEWNPTSCRRIGILIHEAYHVLQLQSLQKGTGMGMARGFLMLYFAHYFSNLLHFWKIGNLTKARSQAYFQHPMEIPAYAQEDAFRQACYGFDLSKLAAENRLSEQDVHQFVQKNPDLIQIQPTQTPHISVIWWGLSIAIALSLIFVRPVGDIIFLPLFWAKGKLFGRR